ncbi:MAG TPA: hypothetical protein VLN46_04900 [Gillisia sp.]|nr:hypothetical protein [Gillisia sp.]
MKNITLILALVFIGVSASANASKATFSPFKYGEAFIFIEGGVEFAVYPNGEFDFHYNPRFLNTSIMHIPNPGRNISYNSGYNYDAFVQYDDYGAVIQVEHVPVYYDHYGRILQAGDVIIRYNNSGLVSRVGNMSIRYNRFNQPIRYTGVINHYNNRYVYRPWHQYYMRPHTNYRVVYYEPYRAYYEPVRMDYFHYNTYYQTNNYYYNKNNFYRPGTPAVAYNYGRRTSTVRDNNTVTRNSSAVSRNDSRSIATDNARNSGDVSRSAINQDDNEITRQRVNMEQHAAAVRAQRIAQDATSQPSTAVTTSRNATPTEVPTRSSVNISSRRSTPVATQPTQSRTVERPAATTTRTEVPQRQNNVRSRDPQNVPSVQRTTSSTVRNQSVPQRVQEATPTPVESSGTSRRGGGRG